MGRCGQFSIKWFVCLCVCPIRSCNVTEDHVIQMEEQTMTIFREAVARIPTGNVM